MARGRKRDLAQDAKLLRITSMVHDLSERRVSLTTTQIAAWMQRAVPVVSVRVAHLVREGLLEYDGERGYRPTAAGRAFLAATPETVEAEDADQH